jgi:hypothetical protein
MLRSRVLKHWAAVVGVESSTLSIPEAMREVLKDDPELTIADMKKWVLRECDVPDYKYWMPHRVITGPIVKVYYVWCHVGPVPPHTIVLVIGGGRAEIHKWTDGKLEVQKAKVESTPSVPKPDITESLQIMKYLSDFNPQSGGMTFNGAKVKKIE